MKKVTKIVMMALCAALALSSCKKNRYTPEEEDKFVPFGFTAVSQTAMVKSGDVDLLSNYYSDFGVWGIARNEDLVQPYILWSRNALEKVNQAEDTNDYIPEGAAYWVSGYQYNFIAIAPYESAFTVEQVNSDDVMAVTIDLNDKYESAADATVPQYDAEKELFKYENPTYGFDVMAAVAETDVIGSQKPSNQHLTFYHMMSKISITITFIEDKKDENGNDIPLVGEVSKIVITGVDSQGIYAISGSDDDSNIPTVTTLAFPEQTTPTEETLTFEKLTSLPVRFNMLPQNVAGMKMYLDFELKKNGKAFNFMLDLGNLSVKDFLANGRYNWKLKITPQFIYFSGEDPNNPNTNIEPIVQRWETGAENPSVDIK